MYAKTKRFFLLGYIYGRVLDTKTSFWIFFPQQHRLCIFMEKNHVRYLSELEIFFSRTWAGRRRVFLIYSCCRPSQEQAGSLWYLFECILSEMRMKSSSGWNEFSPTKAERGIADASYLTFIGVEEKSLGLQLGWVFFSFTLHQTLLEFCKFKNIFPCYKSTQEKLFVHKLVTEILFPF